MQIAEYCLYLLPVLDCRNQLFLWPLRPERSEKIAAKTYLKTRVAIVLLFVLGAASAAVHAEIIYVDDDGPANFNNIQDAINAAQDADTVIVGDGTYTGYGNRDIDFLGKEITVRSANGPENCIIDCRGAGRGFHFQSGEDEDSIVQGFTITNGIAPEGGAIYCSQSSPKLINCVLRANEGTNDDSGGGAIYNDYSSPTVINCTFIENEAYPSAAFGGAIHNNTSSPTLTNCTFLNNKAWSGGAIFNNKNSDPVLTNCTFTNNTASQGGGVSNCVSSPKIEYCTFTANSAFYGGGLYNLLGDMMVINCSFAANTSSRGGGAVWNSGAADAVFLNCMFSGNSADGDQGGGIESNTAVQTLINCTFSGNTGAIEIYDDSVLNMQNCIVANDRGRLYFESENVVEINYCCIQDWVIQKYGGTGNFDADPRFVDPDGVDNIFGTKDDNLRLLPGSPCIDAGDPNYIAEPNETDLDGKPRILDGDNDGVPVVDMGAYEYRFTISAEARIVPQTINLASKGNWITCYIRLPEEYNVADIDTNTVLLDGQVKAESVLSDERQQVATARFSREDVQAILDIGQVELRITGQLTEGKYFEAKDVITVIVSRKK